MNSCLRRRTRKHTQVLQRQRDRETERQRDREAGRQETKERRDRETERQRDREAEGQTYRETEGQTYRETERQRDGETERQSDGGTDIHRDGRPDIRACGRTDTCASEVIKLYFNMKESLVQEALVHANASDSNLRNTCHASYGQSTKLESGISGPSQILDFKGFNSWVHGVFQRKLDHRILSLWVFSMWTGCPAACGAVSSHEFEPLNFKARGSNSRIVAYVDLNMSLKVITSLGLGPFLQIQIWKTDHRMEWSTSVQQVTVRSSLSVCILPHTKLERSHSPNARSTRQRSW